MFTYANGIDLLAISQIIEGGFPTVLGQYTYNYLHRPLTYTDAAGQTTRYAYNAAVSDVLRPRCTDAAV